jgi:hypothetical protein
MMGTKDSIVGSSRSFAEFADQHKFGCTHQLSFFTLPIPYHSSSSVHGERVIFSGTEGSTASLSLAALCLLFGTFGDDGLLDSGESYSATKMKDVDLVRPNQ